MFHSGHGAAVVAIVVLVLVLCALLGGRDKSS